MGDHNEDYVPKKYGKQQALDDLDFLDGMSDFRPSKALREKEKKDEEKKEVEDTYSDNEWMATLASLRTEKKSKRNDLNKIFNGKKKKKKKKKKGEPKDYREDFEKEISMLQSLLHDQSKLADSLQSRYDQLTAQKTAARGVGKFTTDLVDTLNSSRKECKDIIQAIITTKKNIAELNMKERDKLAKELLGDGESDLSNFASSYLNKILSIDRKDLSGADIDIDDIDDIDDAFGDLDYNLRNSDGYEERSEEANQYMKYENRKVKTKVFYDKENNKKSFFAEDEDGNLIDDYPLPDTIDSIRINESTGVAIDEYGQRFEVIQV